LSVFSILRSRSWARGRYRGGSREVKARRPVVSRAIRVCSAGRPTFAMPIRTIEWRSGCVVMLDQRVLPTREVYRVYRDYQEVARAIKDMVIRGAPAIGVADVAANRALGAHGAPLLEDGATVLTHCNAGALATAGHGTALAIVRAAVEAGKRIQVIACETRPFLQGARLTAWELKKDRIPVTLITDNMAGHLMQRGRVSCVIVGTDRTAANGDVANKIGTYPLAVLAHRHAIPFYVAAPISSIDLDCPRGDKIPIE